MVARLMTQSGTQGTEQVILHQLAALRASDKTPEARRSFALGHLESAQSPGVRNAAALALSDLGLEGCVKNIVDVIMQPGVAASSGTLLYAIEELGGELPLSAFVHVLESGSYEARQQALDLLWSGRVATDDETRDGSLEKLEALGSASDQELAAAASEVLAMLKGRG